MRPIALFLLILLGFQAYSAQSPKRVVTLIPSLAEIAAEIAAQDASVKIVGVSELSDRPESIKTGLANGEIKSVGPYFKPNLEIILSLKPDVVLATKDGTPKILAELLLEKKAPLTVVQGERLEDILDSYRKVGAAIGLAEQGMKLADSFGLQWQALLAEVQKSKCRAKVALAFYDASGSSLIVVGANTFLDDLIQGAGFTNVYRTTGLEGRYPRIAKEDLLSRGADMLLLLATERDSETSIDRFVRQLGWTKKWMSLRDSTLQRPTRGVLAPLKRLRQEACLSLGVAP